uniref:RING-type E3 ubiquitin transferase n=1 Tax=Oryza brachyantha TaxID=4533 RepID=J3MP35_ORYBR
SSPECAVCLAELSERETTGRLLPVCGHGFHEECIVTWLRVNTTCPVCRAAVPTK